MAGDPAEADVSDVEKLLNLLNVWVFEVAMFYCF